MPDLHFKRRPLRLEPLLQRYSQPVYFVTFGTRHRKPLLACDAIHGAFTVFAQRAYRDFAIGVGRYVIMPDHVHLFVRGHQDFKLGKWVGMLKSHLTKSALPHLPGENPWQEGFFDRVLRSDESMGEKWNYIAENPLRAGLVKNSAEWPYQGEIVAIDRV